MAKENVAAQMAALKEEVLAQGAEIGQELRSRIDTLRERVVAGEATSGNPIDDGLFVLGTLDGATIGARLHDIARSARGKQGQLVLFVRRKRVPNSHLGPALTEDHYDDESYTMGVLDDVGESGHVTLDNLSVMLRTSAHVDVWPQSELRTGPMDLGVVVHFFTTQHVEWIRQYGREKVAVSVGDDRVYAEECPAVYLEDRALWHAHLRRAAALLGKEMPDMPEQRGLIVREFTPPPPLH